MEQDDWTEYFGVQYNISQPVPKIGTTLLDSKTKFNDSFNINQSEIIYYSNFTNDDYCTSNNSHAYLNATCEFAINYAEPMYGYIAPFLLATTIVANTLIVVVLSRRHMRTPTNVVLMAMALCCTYDMFTMLFPAAWLSYMYTFGNHYKPLSPVHACQAWHYMNEIVVLACPKTVS